MAKLKIHDTLNIPNGGFVLICSIIDDENFEVGDFAILDTNKKTFEFKIKKLEMISKRNIDSITFGISVSKEDEKILKKMKLVGMCLNTVRKL